MKDLTPRKYESMYEIAYLLFGRASIFVVCIILIIGNLGSIVMYTMIIGDVVSSISTQIFLEVPTADNLTQELVDLEFEDYSWLQKAACSRYFAIIVLGLIQFAIIFKRQLEEMKFVSYIFAAILLIFVCLLFSQLIMGTEVDTNDMDDLTRMKGGYHLITSVLILIFAYNA